MILWLAEFKRQTSPLTPCDLAAAYKLMSAGRRHGKNFFMFYNCGPLSGSSQPHKHLQFMPIPEEEVPPIEKLAQRQRLEVDGTVKTHPYLPSPVLTEVLDRQSIHHPQSALRTSRLPTSSL